MEYNTVIKKEVLKFVTWMEVEVIRPSPINQAQKEKYYMISHVKCKKVDLREAES